MKTMTIRAKILLITLVPLILSICLLSGYYTFVLVEEIKLELHIRGQAIVDHMAPSCEYAVISGNMGELDPLLETTLNEQSVIAVVVLDQEKKIIIEREVEGKHIDPENRHTFLAPIILGAIDIVSEFEGKSDQTRKIVGYVQITLHDLSIQAKITDMIIKVLFYSLILLVFFSLIAIWAAHQLTKPMVVITKAVKTIGEGSLDVEFPIKSGGEMGTLERGIESMAKRLILAKETETEHRHQLERSFQIAEVANSAKGEFISRMSHELRTPLHGIMGLINQMESTQLSPDQESLILKTSAVAQDFIRIVDDILDFSNLESWKWKVREERYSPRAVLNSVYIEYKNKALQKGLSFKIDHSSMKQQVVLGDRVLFKKVIQLLVDNAIKFTVKGYVLIKLSSIEEEGHDLTRISVIDTGPGIASNQRDYVFEPFYQIETPLNREHAGCGMGLSLANRILAKMGSHLNLNSDEGEGSTFWFDINLL